MTRCLVCGSTADLMFSVSIRDVHRPVCFWCWTAPRRKPVGGRASRAGMYDDHRTMEVVTWDCQRKRPIEDEDGWRDYDHGFRDGYQSALRERSADHG